MFGCIGQTTVTQGKRLVTAASFTVMIGLMTGCSSVPDAINPVSWYDGAADMLAGEDAPAKSDDGTAAKAQDAAPAKPVAAEGLLPDRSRAKYAAPVTRQATPTKPLVRRAPAATEQQSQTAAAPAPAASPAPVVPAAQPPQQAATPEPAPQPAAPEARAPQAQPAPMVAQPAPTADAPRFARDTGPAAPPATVEMTPPARPDIPATVPGMPRLVKQQFERRLAESSATVVRPDGVQGPAPASYGREEEPIHLVPPTKHRGGGKLAAPAPELPAGPAASFQVASLGFKDASATLTRADRASIAEVARLYRQSGGVVRVVGIAPAPSFSGADAALQVMGSYDASMQRAKAVAKELTRRGVPGHKIMIGADPAPAGFGDEAGARVYLDVI